MANPPIRLPTTESASSAGANVLWLQSGGCGGCSMSLLCADTTDFHGHLRDAGLNLLWHPSLSLETGDELVSLLNAVLAGTLRLDILCIEGSLLACP
jgi:uptake hydrogenase small subunit